MRPKKKCEKCSKFEADNTRPPVCAIRTKQHAPKAEDAFEFARNGGVQRRLRLLDSSAGLLCRLALGPRSSWNGTVCEPFQAAAPDVRNIGHDGARALALSSAPRLSALRWCPLGCLACSAGPKTSQECVKETGCAQVDMTAVPPKNRRSRFFYFFFIWRSHHPASMRPPVKLLAWKYGVVLVLFVVLSVLNVAAVEQDYYKARLYGKQQLSWCGVSDAPTHVHTLQGFETHVMMQPE